MKFYYKIRYYKFNKQINDFVAQYRTLDGTITASSYVEAVNKIYSIYTDEPCKLVLEVLEIKD